MNCKRSRSAGKRSTSTICSSGTTAPGNRPTATVLAIAPQFLVTSAGHRDLCPESTAHAPTRPAGCAARARWPSDALTAHSAALRNPQHGPLAPATTSWTAVTIWRAATFVVGKPSTAAARPGTDDSRRARVELQRLSNRNDRLGPDARDCPQISRRRIEDGMGAAEVREQLARSDRTDARQAFDQKRGLCDTVFRARATQRDLVASPGRVNSTSRRAAGSGSPGRSRSAPMPPGQRGTAQMRSSKLAYPPYRQGRRSTGFRSARRQANCRLAAS